jgi:hypothetical protein
VEICLQRKVSVQYTSVWITEVSQEMAQSKRTIAAMLVALFVLGGLGNAHGVILCLAADGHATIESALEACCSEVPSTDDPSRERMGQQLGSSVRDSSHCGPCIDIPFGIGGGSEQPMLTSKDASALVKAPVVFASGFHFSPSVCAARPCNLAPQRAGDERISSLRATVLLV